MRAAVLKQSIRLEYPGHFKAPAHADVKIYDVAGKTVVLISQPRKNYTELSVTNGIERIVTALLHTHSALITVDDIFIEHYSAQDDYDRREFDKPSFDVVEFNWRSERLASFLPVRHSAFAPEWHSLGQDGFSELTGLDPEEV